MERLVNSRWGFESNCFVCEEQNASGLRIPFFYDPDTGDVSARFELDDRFSGAPSYVHGGVVLAILDEAMAWATIASARQFAVTKETTAKFRQPVRIGAAYRVNARVVDDQGALRCVAEIITSDGAECAQAEASFVPLGPAQAADAIGQPVTGSDAGLLRRDTKEPLDGG